MSKKVLAVYFTQSGQLEQIIHEFTRPLSDSGDITVEKVRIEPQKKFPFPWTSPTFFDAMPESVDGVPAELENFSFKESKYDLIIFGYQPWFLSPSIPMSSLAQHPGFIAVAKDTPLVTISGCRNMWINAQEKLKRHFKSAGTLLKGNIALVDKHNNYASLITIFYWMLTGKKDRKWGVFPRPGVSDEDIAGASVFGETVKKHLLADDWDGLQPALVQQKGVDVKYSLMFIERKAGKIFKIWSKIIHGKKNRAAWLVGFKYYLLIALCIAAPIILTVDAIFFKPFLGKRIKKQKAYYEGVTLES
ncbi:hypothetical protein DC498_15420 [Terrimonas sp.]|uniref:hypothetical protein n=1 Tax=Terrimonas sp. TaxID=1914338 RepID=UPI000D51FD87|nr:hypothetical protein [Terrimonas sp.]PVD51269.1 hypothetical protein DC498_15420 [Terrimonas sp.]